MIQLVWIDVPSGGFPATVNLSVASLDPNAMPTHLEGSFLTYGTDGDDSEGVVHADRHNDGSDPIMYFNARRNAYRFFMKSKRGDHFNAESLTFTPMTAGAGS